AAVQTDRVLAALLHLERDVDGVGASVALDIGCLALFQHFEVAELVQAQDAEIPKAGVEHVAFIEQDLTADDFIARSRVAREIDAAHEKLFAFVSGQGQIDLVSARKIERRLRYEVNESEFAIELAHLLEPLAQLGRREDVALGHAEQAARQRFRRAEELHTHVVDLFQMEQPSLFHGYRDVHRLAATIFFKQRDLEAVSAGVAQNYRVVEDLHLEIALVLIRLPDALFVLFELRSIVGFGEEILKEPRMRNADRPQVLHRADDPAIVENLVARDIDLADFDLWTFHHVESHF